MNFDFQSPVRKKEGGSILIKCTVFIFLKIDNSSKSPDIPIFSESAGISSAELENMMIRIANGDRIGLRIGQQAKSRLFHFFLDWNPDIMADPPAFLL